jgi:hypothetical protein
VGCDRRRNRIVGGRFSTRVDNSGVPSKKTADPKAGGDVCGRG